MKTILLKDWKGKIKVKDASGSPIDVPLELSTVGLIRECLDFIPERGLNFMDFKNRKVIDDAIEKLYQGKPKNYRPAKLELEDAQFTILVDIVQKMQWAIKNKFVEEFIFLFI